MTENSQKATNFYKWFSPRFRKMGTWAFILNRITGLGLSLYLFLHLIMLGKLAQGAAAYDSFIAFAKNPVILIGELFVVAAAFIHGLNGIRIALTSFGNGAGKQKQMFVGFMGVAFIAIAYFGIRMLAH